MDEFAERAFLIKIIGYSPDELRDMEQEDIHKWFVEEATQIAYVIGGQVLEDGILALQKEKKKQWQAEEPVRLRVANNGSGISANTLPNLVSDLNVLGLVTMMMSVISLGSLVLWWKQRLRRLQK